MSAKKILTTGKVPPRKADDRPVTGGGSVMTGRPPGLTAVQYIEKYGTVEEKNELASRISERRSNLPRFVYLVCDSCGWKMKTLFGDRDIQKSERPEYCLSCNRQGYLDGAIMRHMKPAEIRAFEKSAVEKETKAKEQMFRAAFFNENHRRAGLGLPAFTEDEFRAHQKAAWLAMAGRGGAK